MIYVLVDIKRRQIGVHQLVDGLEQAMIKTLEHHNIAANADSKRRGVYVDQRKIGAIGLKIKRHCSYHGLAFNYATNLSYFEQINPCGYADLRCINFIDLVTCTDDSTHSQHVHHDLATQIIQQISAKKQP